MKKLIILGIVIIGITLMFAPIIYSYLVPSPLRDMVDVECAKKYADEKLLDETDKEIIGEWMNKHIECTTPQHGAFIVHD